MRDLRELSTASSHRLRDRDHDDADAGGRLGDRPDPGREESHDKGSSRRRARKPRAIRAGSRSHHDGTKRAAPGLRNGGLLRWTQMERDLGYYEECRPFVLATMLEARLLLEPGT